jgi:hypothetical protein
MTLRSVHGGSKCSMNASNFKGIRFRARGKGRVAVNLQVPEVVPGEYEGRCKDRCWDTHKKWIVLGEQWQSYSLPWDVFQQDGWGVAARFSPSQLLGLTFAAGKGDLPVDLWVDDVEFISDAPPVAAAAAPATVAPATVTPAMPDAAARP